MPDHAGPHTTNATVALRLAEAFRRHGVTLTFGQSLPSAFHLASPHVGIDQKVYRQENAGGTMADGYARISRKVGVVTAQNGPAATLLVPPLAEALKASIPVLALVQEVTRDTADRNAFQELDHLNMFAPVAKWVRRIDRADRLDDYVDMAFTAATSGRPGPVVLLVPADLLTEPAAPLSSLLRPRAMSLGQVPLDRLLADPAAIAAAADALAAARHPLVVAGGGIHLSGAAAELAALQEAAHLPVGTTVMGKGGVDETHPLSLGVIGYVMGQGSAAPGRCGRSSTAPMSCCWSATAPTRTARTAGSCSPPNTRFIHLDADPMEVGRNYEAMRLVGDAKLTLAALTEALRPRDLATRVAARPGIEAEIASAITGWRRTIADITTRDAKLLRPERLMAELDAMLRPEDIVVADASYSSIWIANYLTAKRPGQRFLTPRGLAGLGWGLPMAIGARIAAEEAGSGARVVCLCGDGGFAPFLGRAGDAAAAGAADRHHRAEQRHPRLPEACRGGEIRRAHQGGELHRGRPRRHRPGLRRARRAAGAQRRDPRRAGDGAGRRPPDADRHGDRPGRQAADLLLCRPLSGALLMLALRKTAAAFGLEFQDIPDPPPPGPAEVVLRVDAVGICGSDVHAYEWTAGYEFMVPNLPLTMGHEFAGTIIRNGTGSGFAEGDRVAVIPFVFCGHLRQLPGRRHPQLPGTAGHRPDTRRRLPGRGPGAVALLRRLAGRRWMPSWRR